MRKVTRDEAQITLNTDSSCDFSPEARERRLASLAMDRAEQQLIDGTASSQVITHFLKLASRDYELQIEKLEEENKLLRAKTENLQSQKRTEEFYAKVLHAMGVYSGTIDETEDTNLL